MNELSLFSGAGGGLLGTKLLGWKNVGYVEWDKYCQQVIAKRIEDGILDEAPIFTDVREFLQSGAAEQYRGIKDLVITAGFPCQPFSVAGKRAGEDDERNMWPTTIGIIRAIKPPLVFLENVPGLLSAGCGVDNGTDRSVGYFGTVLRDLAESGYDARWRVLSAAEVGAPHKRDRLWIVAFKKLVNTENNRVERSLQNENERRERRGQGTVKRGSYASEFSDTCMHNKFNVSGEQCKEQEQHEPSECSASKTLSYTNGIRPQGSWWTWDPGYSTEEEYRQKYRTLDDGGWSTESLMGRVANGVANRVDRLKSLGNGQVPQCVAAAFRLLTEG